MNELVARLKDERGSRFTNGIYLTTQVDLAYHSNRLEGSKLSREQVRYLFDNKVLQNREEDEPEAPFDDYIETKNHFRAFNYMLDTIEEPLSESIIKKFAETIKAGTSAARGKDFALGDYKKAPIVIDLGFDIVYTASPEETPAAVKSLLEKYAALDKKIDSAHAYFHMEFETIHPFSDGNGRTGRLILFREMLKNDLMPSIIPSKHRREYMRSFPHRTLDIDDNAPPDAKLVAVIRKGQEAYQNKLAYFFNLEDLRLKTVDYSFPGNISVQEKWESNREKILVPERHDETTKEESLAPAPVNPKSR
jgi:Fic family protein